MHIIEKVAKDTTRTNRTHFTDENFIRVFFYEYIRIATVDSPTTAEAIVWITQPSRHNRFLGVARSIQTPTMLTSTTTQPSLISKKLDCAIVWFSQGQRVRGRYCWRGNSRQVVVAHSEDDEMPLWPYQMAAASNVQFQLSNQNQRTERGLDTTDTTQQTEHPNTNDDSDSDMPLNNEDQDDGSHNDTTLPNTGLLRDDSNTEEQSNNRRSTTADRNDFHYRTRTQLNHVTERRSNSNSNDHQQLQQHVRRIIPDQTEQDQSINVADGIIYDKNSMKVEYGHPNLDDINEVPSWCQFFTKTKKKNYFAQMLCPNGWIDRYGKSRSAIDVLVTRIILSKIFEIRVKTKRSFVDITKMLKEPDFLNVFCNFPFTVRMTGVMATIESIFEDRSVCKDKFRSMLKWL